jgi:hypothetical protein
LIVDGCVIGRGTVIENSVIGVRTRIGENVTIRNTYIMGAEGHPDSIRCPRARKGARSRLHSRVPAPFRHHPTAQTRRERFLIGVVVVLITASALLVV